MNELFFELIRVAIGTQERLSRTPSAKEWKRLFKMAERQRLLGICFYGVKKIASPLPSPEGKGESFYDGENRVGIPEELYDYWLGTAALIQQQNQRMNKYTEETVKLFRENGFPCCVMKGQSVARLYNEGRKTKDERQDERQDESNSLGMFRQSGDIDLWVAGGREKLCEFSMHQLGKVEGLTYRHIHFSYFKDVEVEAHFIPGNLLNPFHNSMLQKFFKQYKPTMDYSIDAPAEFNVIYILQHCFKHFLERGIGMRQVMDYYFVLQSRRPTPTPSLNSEGNLETILRNCGLLKFAKAMMWVLMHVFECHNESLTPTPSPEGKGIYDNDKPTPNPHPSLHSPSRSLPLKGRENLNWRERYPWMIVEPDEKEGKFVLKEIMHTGNFGKFDKRYNWNIKTPLKRFIANQKWNVHLITHYPSEILWSPFFNIYRYFLVKKWMRTVKG